jgi:hypothetical protein
MNYHRAFPRKGSAWLLPVFGLLLAVASVRGGGARSVTGFYSLEGVMDLGDEVRVTVHMRLVNPSDEDYSEAKFVLRGTHPWVRIRGTVPPLLLRPHSEDSFTEDFTVQRAEYERWQKGVQPLLVMQFSTPEGKKLKQAVRLVLRPSPREQ